MFPRLGGGALFDRTPPASTSAFLAKRGKKENHTTSNKISLFFERPVCMNGRSRKIRKRKVRRLLAQRVVLLRLALLVCSSKENKKKKQKKNDRLNSPRRLSRVRKKPVPACINSDISVCSIFLRAAYRFARGGVRTHVQGLENSGLSWSSCLWYPVTGRNVRYGRRLGVPSS